MNITVCPSCGSKRIRKVRRNWTGDFRGQLYRVPNLEYFACPDCQEKVYDRQAMHRIEARSPAFAKSKVEKRSA